MHFNLAKLQAHARKCHAKIGGKLALAFFIIALPGQKVYLENYYSKPMVITEKNKKYKFAEREVRLGKFLVSDFNKSFRVQLKFTAAQYRAIGEKYLNDSPREAFNQLRIFMLDYAKTVRSATREL